VTLKPQTISFLGYPKVILYTKFEHFAIIRFQVMLRTNRQTDRQTDRQTNRQTDRQTDRAKHLTNADRLCWRG